MKISPPFSLVILVLFCSSCQNAGQKRNQGAIVFNDSATIVTEKDSQFLKDEFTELESKTPPPAIQPVAKPENQQNKVSVAPGPQHSDEHINQSGFVIDYESFKVLIPGISTKEYKKQVPANGYGVSYQVVEGDLIKSQLVISGVKDISISQRYQSNLSLKENNKSLDLDNMGSFISEWTSLKLHQKGSQFVADLGNLNSLDFKQFSNATLKNAVQKELRAKRVNSQTVKEWMNSIRKVRSAKDKPCQVKLNNVQWKLTGTDNQGNTINKLIRIDN